ncbi:hypothetical protein GCM10007862_24380 [Dyella lipolytica]|nr:hypothetical protein GCM10007862_24380 [Dyella lipolytica]
MRVNEVIISNTAGSMVSTVISATTCNDRLQFWPAPAFCTVRTGMPADWEIGAIGAIGVIAVEAEVLVVVAACAPMEASASRKTINSRPSNVFMTFAPGVQAIPRME